MFAKVKISGVLETITGLHIGGSSAFSAIGAVDSLSSGMQGRICR